MQKTIHILVLLAPLFAASTIYVATTGENSSTCGTFEQPCADLFYAISISSENDNILIEPGRYIVQPTDNAEINVAISISNSSSMLPTFDLQGSCPTTSVLQYLGTFTTTISGIEFTNLHCELTQSNQSTPSWIYIAANGSMQMDINNLGFYNNFYKLGENQTNWSARPPALVEITGPATSINFNTLNATNNMLTSVLAYNTRAEVKFRTCYWENTTFLQYPTLIMESSYVTLATSTAKNNNFAQYLAVSPLASVLLANYTVNIQYCSFENNVSPVLNLGVGASVNIAHSVFDSNSNFYISSRISEPEEQTFVSCVYSPTSAVGISNTQLINNNLHDSEKLLGTVVRASLTDVFQSVFAGNYGVSLLMQSTSSLVMVEFRNNFNAAFFYQNGSMRLQSVLLHNNTLLGNPSAKGMVSWTNSIATILNCDFEHNTADVPIVNAQQSTLTCSNFILYDNSVPDDAEIECNNTTIEGVYILYSGPITCNNCTAPGQMACLGITPSASITPLVISPSAAPSPTNLDSNHSTWPLILFTCLISTVGLILLLFLCIVCFALQKSRPESYMELNQVEEDEN